MRLTLSQPVLLEAERNVRENLGPEELRRLRHLTATTPFTLAGSPTGKAYEYCVEIVGEKDAHVLASAVTSGASYLLSSYLLSLDARLIRRVNAPKLDLRALPPAAFIRKILPLHPDYPTMR
jgi:hypothetical protein